MRARALLVPLVVVAVAAAGSAAGASLPNAVGNGGFERGVAGWVGHRATIAPTAPGVESARAVRVSLAGRPGSGFSLVTARRPVVNAHAGATYVGRAWVRGPSGRQLCLRIREWRAGAVVGTAQACVAANGRWQALPAAAYRVRDGGDLDLFVFAWHERAGDSFDVDGVVLAEAAGAPASAPRQPAPRPAQPAPALAATAVDHAHVRLDWRPVDGAAVYRVLRGGVVIGVTAATTFTDALLWPLTRYSFSVEAVAPDGAVLRTETVSAATPPLPAGGFPRAFPAGSIWNQPVGNAALHPRSAPIAAYVAANARRPNMTLRSWGVAVSEARPTDPRFDVPCVKYRCTLGAFGAVPVPVTALPDPEGDGHLAVYEPSSRRVWDMYEAARTDAGWTAGAGAALSLEGDAIAPRGTASGNAANFPLLGGLIRPEELLQGRIDHALVFGMPGVNRTGFVCPATHNDGSTTDPNAPMEGQRLQLDPAVNVDALPIPAWQKTIARALQEYGMYLRDSSGSLVIYAENPIARGYDAWGALGLPDGGAASLAGIPWDRMRVLTPPC